MERNKLKIPMILIGIILVISIGFNIYLFEDNKEDNIEFFNDYIIGINDYNEASFQFDLARLNLKYGNDYTEEAEGYYYEFAVDYYDKGKEQINNAKEFLQHSKKQLNGIKDNAPNTFYDIEIENRLKQINLLLSLSNKVYSLLDYMDKQLYEINYGSETEATRYYNMYNDMIIEMNEELYTLSDVSQEIDLSWDQNWYPLLERTE